MTILVQCACKQRADGLVFRDGQPGSAPLANFSHSKIRSCNLLSWPVCFVKKLFTYQSFQVCWKGLWNFEKDFVCQISCSLLSWVQNWMKLSNFEGNAVLIKERCYCFIHSLELDFETSTGPGDATDCLVRDLKPFRALFFLMHCSACCFLCNYECTMPVIIFFVDHKFRFIMYELCLPRASSWSKTGHPKICAVLWKCLIHWSFFHKIADSILGPAFLSFSMVCNHEQQCQQNVAKIMQIKVVSINVVFAAAAR